MTAVADIRRPTHGYCRPCYELNATSRSLPLAELAVSVRYTVDNRPHVLHYCTDHAERGDQWAERLRSGDAPTGFKLSEIIDRRPAPAEHVHGLASEDSDECECGALLCPDTGTTVGYSSDGPVSYWHLDGTTCFLHQHAVMP